MNKTFLKATIGLTLFSAMLALNTQSADAEENTKISQLYADTTFDVTQGWDVQFSTNLANVHAEDIFKQNVKSPTTSQKMVLNNFGNIGKAELKATKTIPMKKGHTYNLDLIYAMQFSSGIGYIDFNGEKIDAASVNNDALDHVYQKSVKATADTNYVITIYYQVPLRATGYLKLAYDTSKGNGIEEQSDVAAPVLNAPLEKQSIINGTGVSGNTVNIYDAAGNLLGTGVVNSQNTFSITANRPFIKGEEITGYQVDKNGVVSEKGTTTVQELLVPTKPELDPITDESTTITGKADPGATVNVKVGDEEYETVADANGDFSIDLDHKFPFGTEVEATAKDDKGNSSEVTDTTVGYADTAKIDFDYNLSSIDQLISGTSSRPNTKVEIKVGSRIFYTTTDANGNYEFELPTTYKPGTPVQAKLTDKAGTEVVANQIILPRMPSLPGLAAGLTEIEGEVDPSAVVQLTLTKADSTVYNFEVTADASGHYRIVLKDPDTGANISLGWGDRVSIQATITSLNLTSEVLSQSVFSRALS